MTSFSTTESAQSKAELFTLPADQMSHIQVFTVAQAPVARMLRTSGVVAYNAFPTTPVISQVGGPVSRIMVTPGQEVKKGEPMLYVTSPDYSLARSAYVKARDAFQLADKIYKRDKDLSITRPSRRLTSNKRNPLARKPRPICNPASRPFASWEFRTRTIWSTKPPSSEVALLAPMAGEVVERLCSPGQLLQTGATQCFTLSNMSSVWVLVNIYQNDVAYVHVGDEVTISNEAYPGEVHGKIQYIAPALDPTTRTLQARIEAQNPGERLKKDMYVTAQIRAGVIANAMMIPDAGVLRDTDNMPYVYIQTGRKSVCAAHGHAGRKPGRKNASDEQGCRPATKSSATAACFCNFRIRYNAERGHSRP